MRIREVSFPEGLLDAQKSGDMVVFAGAGVSIPAPSNYPDFRELGIKVANGVLSPEPNEPMDHFMGRLHHRGLDVHSLVAKLLTDPMSKPNPLHVDLLGLFKSSQATRLVTTNFDLHFTNAAVSIYGANIECEDYYAPALPLGNSFSGIVYLHGGVKKAPNRLVLTDADFGRAYLTEGWARVFLQRLFARYTVLFVGYSHGDTVMTYLARGLPPERGAPRRFALSVAESEDRWRYLGITPVVYQLTTESNKHSMLGAALSGWAIQARQGALDKEQRIKAIVEIPPPLDLEASDYVESSLKEEATTRFFARYAKTPEWLRWVEQKGFLSRLFDAQSSLTVVDKELAWWFAQAFVLTHVSEALSLIRRHRQQLHPALWNIIAHRLFAKGIEKPAPEALRRWLPVLISLSSPQVNADSLDYLLRDLKFPEDSLLATLLFEHLTRPAVRLEKDFWSEIEGTNTQEDVNFEIAINGSGFWLDHAWQRFFRPNLPALVNVLEPIVTAQLQYAHVLSRAGDKSDSKLDRLSLSRTQIEHPHGGRPAEGIDFLIDVAYEVISWDNANRPDRAAFLIDLWFSSDSQLLKRLAIIGLADSSRWTPDQKMGWLLSHDLLYSFGMKPEVFQVLLKGYPSSSEETKKKLIDRVKKGRTGPGVDTSTVSWKYEIFNLLNWLYIVDPSSALTKSEFDAMQESHPTFGKRTHPDLDIVIGPVTMGLQSPVTVDELLAKTPAEQLDWLISYKPQDPFGASEAGLMETVREASSHKYEWGRDLAKELAGRQLWGSELWSAIVEAWNRGPLDATQWSEALTLLLTHDNALASVQREVASLLKDGIKKDSNAIPNEYLQLAMSLSKRLWSMCLASDTGGKQNDAKKQKEKDWLFAALNHSAGTIATFWLDVLSKQRREAGPSWTGFSAESRGLLEGVVSSSSNPADLAKVILASQLTFLFSSDEEWTVIHILPLFDWSVSGGNAAQAFHGFLAWGRQTEALLVHLLPLYVKAFAHMRDLGKVRGRFSQYLAGVACQSAVNPIESGWLSRFLLDSESEDRIAWASHVRFVLRGMTNEARKAIWDRWVREYWQKRLMGVPIPLDPLELGELVEWCIHFGPAFPEVVDNILSGPAFELRNSYIYQELAKSEIPGEYPFKTAELLRVLLNNEKQLLYDFDQIDHIVRRIKCLNASPPILVEICGELARLGYAAANELKKYVQGND